MQRIGAVDSVRGLVVLLAMLSHALASFAPEIDALRHLTRTATPAFIILFGAMIEVVYLRRLRAGGDRAAIERRLIARMITCYLVFALIVLAGGLGGRFDLPEVAKALLLVGDGGYGNILRTYAYFFGFVLVLLPLAIRFGALVFVAAASVGWAVKVALDALDAPSQYLIDSIVGTGNSFGPSVLPGLTLLAFGLLVGEWLTGRRGPALPLTALVAAAGILAAKLLMVGPGAVAYGLEGTFRRANDPAYFAAGIITTTAYVGLFSLAWARDTVDSLSLRLADIGTGTLFVFGFGNVVLYLLPTYSGNPARGLGVVVVFLAVLAALAIPGSRARRAGLRLAGPVPALIGRAHAAILGWAVPACASVLSAVLPGRGPVAPQPR